MLFQDISGDSTNNDHEMVQTIAIRIYMHEY